ncbi:Hsp20/alpha crystallin family protein [Planococcus shenhongbingii]|uniref:Hsp20/alpha crystallin family protein n=1 Tax=Planococcus shenhongbingii TaxID=3058398 RepID=A0ABT8NFP2_9BACL|nr:MULTISPECIES: Hsp20/alpha crystallin family protein [unclassified Planococcus (in: firmicutes)]MDN7246487.1 Hsp20/alpha crystallin family protein [Planococcus sp. N017]WKA59476.1 Hsp20/alpha crystallin family protein [Planococcus sp. N016]
MAKLRPKRRNEFFPSLFESTVETDVFNKFFGETHYPQVDIKEKNELYELQVDLPGFTKDDIEIEYRDGYLEIRGKKERGVESDEQNERYIRKERTYGSFRRSFYIGEIDEDHVTAAFQNGVLTLNVPKSHDLHNDHIGHRIPIE